MRPLALVSTPPGTIFLRPSLRELPSAALLWRTVPLLLALALVLSACSRTSLPDGPTSALQPFKRGVQAFQDEDYPRAAKMFEQAAALDDRSPVIYYNLGLAYYMLEAFPESIEAYHKALKLDPKFADAHMNLALAYDRTYDLEQANAQYNEFLTLIRSGRVVNVSDGGAPNAPGREGATGAGHGNPGNGNLGNGVSPGASAANGGNPPAGSLGKPAKITLGGQGASSLPVKGQPVAQAGRGRPLAAPISPRAPVGELRRIPTDQGNPSAPKSKDPNSSSSNAWWTQDTPPKTR